MKLFEYGGWIGIESSSKDYCELPHSVVENYPYSAKLSGAEISEDVVDILGESMQDDTRTPIIKIVQYKDELYALWGPTPCVAVLPEDIQVDDSIWPSDFDTVEDIDIPEDFIEYVEVYSIGTNKN